MRHIHLLFAFIALLFHTSAVPPPKCGDGGIGHCHPPSNKDCDDDDIMLRPCPEANATCCKVPPREECEKLGGTCVDLPDDSCPSGGPLQGKCEGDDMECCKKSS